MHVPERGCFPRSSVVWGGKAVVVVAVAIGEIDHPNSQETLFNQNEPPGWGLCSGKWQSRVCGRQETFSFTSNTGTTQGLISPRPSWCSPTSERSWQEWDCGNHREDPHPLTGFLRKLTFSPMETHIHCTVSRGIHSNTYLLSIIIKA